MIIPVVGELVHQAVEEHGRPLAVHAEFAALREVIGLSAKNEMVCSKCAVGCLTLAFEWTGFTQPSISPFWTIKSVLKVNDALPEEDICPDRHIRKLNCSSMHLNFRLAF